MEDASSYILFLAHRPIWRFLCTCTQEHTAAMHPENGWFLQFKGNTTQNEGTVHHSRPNNILNWKSHVYLFIVYGTQQNFCALLYLLVPLLTISPSNDGKPLNEMKKCNQHFYFLVLSLSLFLFYSSTEKNLSSAMEYTHTTTELFNRWLSHGRS